MTVRLTYNQKQSLRSFYNKYDISETDMEVVSEFVNVLQRMGYPFDVVRKIKKEMIKDYATNKKPQVCKHCGQKIYKAMINKPVGIVPNKPICVGCIKDSKLSMFKPKMTLAEAWSYSKLF